MVTDRSGSASASAIPSESALLAFTGGRLAELAAKGIEPGKPVALGEWGNWQTNAANTTTDDNHGRADLPEFIHQVINWAATPANNVAYLCYFDINGDGTGLDLSDTSNSWALFKNLTMISGLHVAYLETSNWMYYGYAIISL